MTDPVGTATRSTPQERWWGATVPPMDTKREIQEFLTSRRARITPEQAGLRTYGGGPRRVPGLRREEVASLAGVSIAYYTKLERGDASGASDAVLESLARAVHLDDVERAHLFDLVRSQQPGPRPRRRRSPPSTVRPGVQRLLDKIAAPAFVRNGRMDYLGMNTLGEARKPAAAGQLCPLLLPRLSRNHVLRRLGQDRRRLRGHSPRGSRPQPA